VTLEQLGRVVDALQDLKDQLLEKNPKLFGVLAEGYLDQINAMRREVHEYLEAHEPAEEVALANED
jgi:hypothetical protein